MIPKKREFIRHLLNSIDPEVLTALAGKYINTCHLCSSSLCWSLGSSFVNALKSVLDRGLFFSTGSSLNCSLSDLRMLIIKRSFVVFIGSDFITPSGWTFIIIRYVQQVIRRCSKHKIWWTYFFALLFARATFLAASSFLRSNNTSWILRQYNNYIIYLILFNMMTPTANKSLVCRFNILLLFFALLKFEFALFLRVNDILTFCGLQRLFFTSLWNGDINSRNCDEQK